MIPIEIDDICSRLLELKAYSSVLSRKMEHEDELPDDPVPFLIERLQKAYARCEAATAADRADAIDELAQWLVKSHQFFLFRLLSWSSEAPWCFRFPKTEGRYRH